MKLWSASSRRSPPQPQAARRGPEAGRLQCRAERRAEYEVAVGTFDGQLAQRPVAYGQRERVHRGLETRGVVAPSEQAAAAAFDVEHQLAVHQHDECPG